jgi:hypothetical protein
VLQTSAPEVAGRARARPVRRARRAVAMPALLVACLAGAAWSVVPLPAAPFFDAMAWVLWGHQIDHLALSTLNGPAFKPLPVALTTVLGLFGDAAPTLWVIVARAGALAALALAGVAAWRLSDRSLLATAAAVAGVALTRRFLDYALIGASEALVVAFALGGFLAWRSGHRRLALTCALLCSLMRVEAWPFAGLAALAHLRRRPWDWPLVAAGVVAVPVLWFGPEYLGSHDVWRSAARAQIPMMGQPALADVPFLASLQAAADATFAAVVLGVLVLLDRPRERLAALWPFAVGAAWVLLVAGLSQFLGFSGEERYTMPGVALASVSGAVGLGLGARGLGRALPAGLRALRPLPPVLAAAALVACGLPHADDFRGLPESLAYKAALPEDLEATVAYAGGTERVLACGPPYVMGLLGPLLAYALDVPQHRLRYFPRAEEVGVVFSTRLSPDQRWAPRPPRTYRLVGEVGAWRLWARCGPTARPGRLAAATAAPSPLARVPPRLGFPVKRPPARAGTRAGAGAGRTAPARRAEGRRARGPARP